MCKYTRYIFNIKIMRMHEMFRGRSSQREFVACKRVSVHS